MLRRLALAAALVVAATASPSSDFTTTVQSGLLAPYAAAGSYSVCHRNASELLPRFVQPPGWLLRPFDALVVSPCTLPPGTRVPALSFGIGYQGWPGRYLDTLSHLASHGFVIVAPRTVDNSPLPLGIWQHQQTLVLSLAWLAGTDLLGPHIDLDRSGAFGHSMGAGDAIVAAALSSNTTFARTTPRPLFWNLTAHMIMKANLPLLPNIRAYACMGVSWEDAPLAALASVADTARGLFFAGEVDSFSPLPWARFAFGVTRGPRTLAVIEGGTHCYVDQGPGLRGHLYPVSQCNIADARPNYLPPVSQLWLVRALLVAHFRARLMGDAAATDTLGFLGSGSAARQLGAPLLMDWIEAA
jgi:hypothetical protein